MKQIKLIPQSIFKPILFALVDDVDFDFLCKFGWSYYRGTRGTIYAYTRIEGRITKMHQLILPSPEKSITPDHINGNGLDNQRNNLRLATKGQQTYNKKRHKDG